MMIGVATGMWSGRPVPADEGGGGPYDGPYGSGDRSAVMTIDGQVGLTMGTGSFSDLVDGSTTSGPVISIDSENPFVGPRLRIQFPEPVKLYGIRFVWDELPEPTGYYTASIANDTWMPSDVFLSGTDTMDPQSQVFPVGQSLDELNEFPYTLNTLEGDPDDRAESAYYVLEFYNNELSGPLDDVMLAITEIDFMTT